MLAPSQQRAGLVSIEDAEAIRGEWIDLARRAIEPNPYYEPDHLIAICRHMRPNEVHWLVLIRDRSSGRLDGLFPVTVKRLKDGFPGGVTACSHDSLIGQDVPLIAGDYPESVWVAFLDFVAQRPELPTVVYFNEFYPDSPCGKALAKAVANQQVAYSAESGYSRAVASNGMSYEAYKERWARKKARNVTSRFKKLSQLGLVELDIVEPGDTRFDGTLTEILELEKAGWKGRAGTALASQENTRNFAYAAYAAGNGTPAVHLATLRLDGKLIAGDINLISQQRAYFIKSAYDEEYSKYGPGVILYTYALEEMLDNGRYERLDSCADAGHPLEEIWLESEKVDRAFVAPAGPANERAIGRLIAARAALFAMRNAARGAARLFKKNH